jgi:hypothetical protein
LRRKARLSPIRGKPTRARARPPGAGVAVGAELVLTTVLMPEVNELAPEEAGETLINNVCVIVKGEGKFETLPFVIFVGEFDCGVVVPAIVVDPATETVPPAKVPLASFVKVAGAPALVCIRSGSVTITSNPCVPVSVGERERVRAVESEIELPTIFNPMVPKTLKLFVVREGEIDAPGGEIVPRSIDAVEPGVPLGVKVATPPDVVIVPSMIWIVVSALD